MFDKNTQGDLAIALGQGRLRGDNQPLRTFTLEYWQDDGWYVGRPKEVAGVMSQGQIFDELEENIKDAYHLMAEAEPAARDRARDRA